MTELWDYPASLPTTPLIDSTEGYPIIPNTSPTFHRKPNTELANLQFSESMTTILGERWNDKLRVFYNLWTRLAFHGLIISGYSHTDSAQGDQGDPNWANLMPYSASGGGSTIGITWDNATETGPQYNSIYPGMGVTDGRNVAVVLDLAFTSQSSMTLTLHKEIGVDTTGKVSLIHESKVPTIPALSLQYPLRAPQCIHAQRCYGSLLPSFKTHFGAQWVSPDGWFCDAFKTPGVNYSQFTSTCYYEGCPLRQAHDYTKPSTLDFSKFWGGRNMYYRRPDLSPISYLGREDIQGLLHTIGMPGTKQHNEDVAHMEKYSYPGWGAVTYPTGNVVDGFDEYLSYSALLAWKKANSIEEEDNIGIFAAMTSAAKSDPCGGTSPSNRALLATSPGYTFETKTAVRRLGTWTSTYPTGFSGYGVRHVQRARPRTYVSPKFNKIVALVSTSETYLNNDTAAATVTWKLPQFGDRKGSPIPTKTKSVTGNLAYYSISGDVAALEFALGGVTVTHGYDESGTTTFDCGGNVVCPDQVREVWNYAAEAKFGGRQEKITPGDVIKFTGSGPVHVIGAEAFGGSVQAGARNPPSISSMSYFLTQNHDKRDIVYVSLKGASGATFRTWLEAATLPVALTAVELSAVAPPTILESGDATGYEPVVYYSLDKTNWVMITPSSWDPVTGEIVVAHSSLPSAEIHLKARLWVNVTKVRHTCEDVTRLVAAVNGLEAAAWWPIGATGGATISAQALTPTIWSNEFYVDIVNGSFEIVGAETYPWRWGSGSGGTRAGQYPDMDFMYGQPILFTFNMQILNVTPPPLLSAATILAANADIDITLPLKQMHNKHYVNDPFEYTSSDTEETDMSALCVRKIWYKTDALDEVEFILGEEIGLGALVEVTIGGVVHRRGTIDVTDLLTGAYSPPSGTGWSYGWAFVPSGMDIPTTLGYDAYITLFTEFMASWTRTIVDSVITVEDLMDSWNVTGTASLSGLKLQLKPEATKSLFRYQPTSSGMYGGANLLG